MAGHAGRFVWYELMTTDAAAAQDFYGSVVGWTAKPFEATSYTILHAGESGVAGVMELPRQAGASGAPPHWMGYVWADSVDAAAEQVTRLGGNVHLPSSDIPGVGRFAVVADPQGAVFALFQSDMPAPGTPDPAPGSPGTIGWHELYAADWQAAFDFYAALFGWRKAEALDMGECGTYQLFSAGGQTVGGMMTKPPQVPTPFWLYYFSVPDIDAALAKVRAGGGQVVVEPTQVPGGGWIVQARDPQGALFALHGPRLTA